MKKDCLNWQCIRSTFFDHAAHQSEFVFRILNYTFVAVCFRLQGFTNHPVPTHEEIQKCLVDIGDKPRTFIGSRQWIGSTEISYCLESMLGVTSRIIAINSGEELSERGSELIYHFKTQGTPIMIGMWITLLILGH